MNELIRPWQARLTPTSAWRGTAAAAAFTVVGMLLNLRVVAELDGAPVLPALFSISVSLGLLAVMFFARRSASVRFAETLFVVNLLAVTFAVVAANQFMVGHAGRWVPFQAQKLGCLVAPLVAPSFRCGLLGLAVHGGSAIIQYSLFPEVTRESIAFGEPTASVAFALAGLMTLLYRYGSVALEQRFAEATAETKAMQQVTDVSFALKDLMNTPLQTLTFAVDLLRTGDVTKPQVLDKIESSVKRLTEINKRLNEYEAQARARDGGHLERPDFQTSSKN